jgi:ribosome-associated protein
MTAQEKVDLIVSTADELKAEAIEVLDVRQKTSIADFFVVCSGTSDRHVQSIAERVEERMATVKSKPIRTDGNRSGWVLQDYGEVLLHVMRDEQRQFYDLEALWKSMQEDPNLKP